MGDTSRYDKSLATGKKHIKAAHDAAKAAYNNQLEETAAEYRALENEAYVNKALQDRAACDFAADTIVGGELPLTVKQKGTSDLQNVLGKIKRQHHDFTDNVNLALRNLDMRYQADMESLEAKNAAEKSAAQLSWGQFDADHELRTRRLEQAGKDSMNERAYSLYTKGMIDSAQFKALTGVEVKKPRTRKRKSKTASQPSQLSAGERQRFEKIGAESAKALNMDVSTQEAISLGQYLDNSYAINDKSTSSSEAAKQRLVYANIGQKFSQASGQDISYDSAVLLGQYIEANRTEQEKKQRSKFSNIGKEAARITGEKVTDEEAMVFGQSLYNNYAINDTAASSREAARQRLYYARIGQELARKYREDISYDSAVYIGQAYKDALEKAEFQYKMTGLQIAKKFNKSISDDSAKYVGEKIGYYNAISSGEASEAAAKEAEQKYGLNYARVVIADDDPLLKQGERGTFNAVTGLLNEDYVQKYKYNSVGETREELNLIISGQMFRASAGVGADESQLEILTANGLEDIAELIRSCKAGNYFLMTDEIKEQIEQELVDEAVDMEVRQKRQDKIRKIALRPLDELYQDLTLKRAQPKNAENMQYINDIKLYIYYKENDIELTGDYEIDRSNAKAALTAQIYNLTGVSDFDEAVNMVSANRDAVEISERHVLPFEISDEWQRVDALLESAPAVLFLKTGAEREAILKSAESAWIGGIRSGVSLGLSEFIGEYTVNPEEVKDLALSGSPIGGTEVYQNGQFIAPSIAEEDAELAKNNPDSFILGNIMGSLLTMPLVGKAAGSAARALGAKEAAIRVASAGVPMAVQRGVKAAVEGGDLTKILFEALTGGTIGAVTISALPPAALDAISKLLQNAPGVVQKAVPTLANAATFALSNAAANTGIGLIRGRGIDWDQILADLPRDFLFGVIINAWSGKGDAPEVNRPAKETEIYISPETGDPITVPNGKTLAETDPEAAEFYGAAAKVMAENEASTNKDVNYSNVDATLKDGITELNRISNKITKRNKTISFEGIKIEEANNAYFDAITGKGKTDTAALKIVECIDQTIGSGNLKPKETARLQKIKAQMGNIDNGITIGDNISSDILESLGASKSGLSKATIKRIVTVNKGKRPEPSTYLTKEYITDHLSNFKGGVTKIKANPPKDVEGIGLGTFVMPKSVADEAIAKANGDFRLLEELLALERGSLGSNPVRVDIYNPKNLRIPSGNEVGALFEYWVPGGYTKGGIMEAVIDPVLSEEYIVTSLK